MADQDAHPSAARTSEPGSSSPTDGQAAHDAAGVAAWGELLDAARITATEQDLELRYLAVLDQSGHGVVSADCVGRLEWDVHPSAVAARLAAIKRGAIESGTARQGRVDVARDGQVRSFAITATPRRDEHGHIVGVLSLAVDQTDVLRARERDRMAHARLASVLGSALDAIVGMGADRRILYFNGAAERLFGVAAEDVVDTGVERLIAESSRGEFDALLRDLVEHDSARHAGRRCVLRGVRANGDVFPIEAAIARSGSGESRMFTLLARAGAEQSQAQRQALQSQKLEGIGRLAGGVAHDFNNLLTVILGYCELLRLRQRGGLELDEIANAARRASQLTRQLLAFSRRQVLQVETLDLNALIRGLHRMLRRTIGDDVLLDVNLADEPLWVVADVGQMEQVLLNLVINARDAMPDGGTLRIATRVTERTPAADGAGPVPSVELIVADSGVGMTDDVRAHIFEPFFTTKGDAGTGLGLAMVYGIVTQTGGHIACESVVGQGATFHVWLPLSSPPAHENRGDGASQPAALQGRETVLVLEDDMLVRELAVRALREYGYTVLEAQDVDAARRHLDHPALALVLADVITRGGSVDDLTSDIARRRPGLPVLLMTGYSEALSQRPLEPSHLLRKPFTPTELLTRIRALLGPSPKHG